MNGVHLVTLKKKRVKTDRKWAECTAQGQPRRLGRARPARPAPACRASSALPRAQRPAARPAPCRPPSALPPACACAQLLLACAGARPPAPVHLPSCAPQHALRATPPHTRLPRAPGMPSACQRPPAHAQRPASSSMGNSPFQGLHQIFFFSFFPYYHYYYFPVISSSWKITKIIIIIIIIIFSFSWTLK